VGQEMGSLLSLREHNRRRVVETLRDRGTASRAELARLTGLSRSTVSTLIAELQENGLVVERDAAPDGVAPQGRPPVLLSLDRSAGAVVGLDFGHADVRVAVADLSRTILAERVVEMDVDHAGTGALDAAAELVADALDEAGIDRRRVLAAGMALSGPVDHEEDRVHRSAILPSWGGIRPGAELSRRIDVPVHIENDANLGALAEVTMGAARGVEDAIYLMIGAGVGAGIMVGGRLLHGAGGTAGELGHVLVDDNGLICRCGNRGCLETIAGGPAVVELLRRTYGADLTLEAVLEHVAAGDPGAVRAVTDAGHAVGLVIASLCNVLNPEAIVIGGELAAAGEALLEPVRTAIERHAIRPAADDVRVVPSELGERAEVLGALIHAGRLADVPHLSHISVP
jgi:predicted NBD/HSP70 family sugar kinase